jgi:hypothetical protein
MSVQIGVEPAAEVTNTFFFWRSRSQILSRVVPIRAMKAYGEGKGGIDPRILNRIQQRPE